MSDWQAWVGKEQVQTDTLTPALLDRFRATIDSDAKGDIAPQGIHFALCLPDAATATLGPDGHPPRGGFLPPVELPRRMWASSSIEFAAPIHSGAAIRRVSRIAAIRAKSGSTGALVFVDVEHRSFADDVLAVTETQCLVYRGDGAPATPAPGPDVDAPDWPWQCSLVPQPPLLFRFSALTFNSHRIHYDLPYARDAEGYRGLVVHGPLMATLLLDMCARQLGPNALSRLAFRGVSPAYAGEALHLRGRADGNDLTLAAFGSDGRDVMTAKATVRG
jgi:3-methylfumaryl-CoA hydratase